MGTVGEEDHHGKRVAKQEFAGTSDEEEDATKEDIGGGCCDRRSTGALPSH